MGNPFAYLVLVAFVPLAVLAFGRLPPAAAGAAVALAGCLFLPERAAFNLEMMPPLGKDNITYLSILIGALVHRAARLRSARPGRGPELLLLPLVLANFATVAGNQNPVADGGSVFPGLTPYFAVSMSISDVFRYVLPFFLGRALFRTQQDLHVLMAFIAGAGLLYSAFILVEIGLSGVFGVFQFGAWVYDVFTSVPSFRWGGLQPVVFMWNPLAVALFMASSALAATAIARTRLRVARFAAVPATLWLLFVVVLCRNVASIVFSASFSMIITLLRSRHVAWICVGLAAFVCSYPALRIYDVFPDAELVAFAEGFDPTRARSLGGRFDEEDQLLEKGRDQLWLGWGQYERIPIAEQGRTGAKSIDPFWVIISGLQGLIGLELRLALLLLPIFVAWRRQQRVASRRDQTLLAALMAIVAIRSVDLLVNGWWTNLPAFLAGALYGLSHALAPGRAMPRRRRSQSSVGVAPSPHRRRPGSGGDAGAAGSRLTTPARGSVARPRGRPFRSR